MAVPTDEVTTELVLIRHGESVAQVERFLSGHETCTGLSEHGRRQAVALRDRLMNTGELASVDAVYTSILQRTIETHEILAPALGEAAPERECDWCEIHPGEAEGLSWDDFWERYPLVGDPYDPYRHRSPGGESWAEFFVRAGRRLRQVAEDHAGERVVVVCHGGIVGASFVALGELTPRQGMKLTYDVVNTSITEWRWRAGEWGLVRFNDAAHLSTLRA